MATAIDMYLRQITLTGGIPFSLSLPKAPAAVSYTHLDVYKRQELDYLIYNDPLSYADLILNGDPEEYLKNAAGSHWLED